MTHHTDKTSIPSPDDLARHIAHANWEALAEALGLGGTRLELPRQAWASWGWSRDQTPATTRMWLLGSSANERLLLVEGLDDLRDLRRLAMASWRHNPTVDVLWWWPRHDLLTAAHVSPCPGTGEPRLRTMTSRRSAPTPLELERWGALAQDGARDLGARTEDAMRQDRIARAFFDDFVTRFDLLREAMIDGPLDPAQRHDVALLVMLRLVVLYFLQARGALDGQRRYLATALDEVRTTSGRSMWTHVLYPLFFGALNRPRPARSHLAKALGRMPFLNGGLFEPSAAELDHPNLRWDNEVWEDILHGFFERYRFALREPIGADEHDAIDPEVLGKVFEGLMYADSRRASGSFYTPRRIVRQIVEDALTGLLADRVEAPEEDVRVLVHTSTPEQLHSVPRDLAYVVGHTLKDLAILDPAVGTGAFLLEALHAVRRTWRNLAACGVDIPHDPDSYRGVRHLVHEHLYGVDINTTATRLCALRIWLSLLELLPEDLSTMIHHIDPLPNLTHRIMPGDSLVGALEMLTVTTSSHDDTPYAPRDASRAIARHHVHTLTALHRQHLTAHGAAKQALRRKLERQEATLVGTILEARIARIDERLAALDKVEQGSDLFGEPTTLTSAQRTHRDALREQRQRLDAMRKGTASTQGFAYEVRCAQVLAQGGFDLIITNPPWVRATRQGREQKALYDALYRTSKSTLWPQAQQAGVRATFGAQADLAALFVERSLHLLKPGGRFAALLPSKLLHGLHGSSVRSLIGRHDLMRVEDLSEATHDLFDATTYPMILEVRHTLRRGVRRAPQRSPRLTPHRSCAMTLWRGGDKLTWRAPARSLWAFGEHASEPWMLVPPALRELLHAMRASSAPLGSIPHLRPRRGIMTGCNDAFIFPHRKMLEGPCGGEEEVLRHWTRPTVRGRDVHAWALEGLGDPDHEHRILWPYTDDLSLHTTLPAPLTAHVASFYDRLTRRSDMREGDCPWRLFRVQPEITDPKVVWRDMAPFMMASPCAADVIPLNTTYYIPCSDDVRAFGLCVLLNSWPARAMMWGIAEHARGGWRRHFAWVIASLPTPHRWLEWLSGTPDHELCAMCDAWRTLPNGADLASEALGRAWGLTPNQLAQIEAHMHHHLPDTAVGILRDNEEVAA